LGKKHNKIAKAWKLVDFGKNFKLTLYLPQQKKLNVTTDERKAALQEGCWQMHKK